MNNYIVISLNLVFCRSACSLTEADEEETILSHLFIEEDLFYFDKNPITPPKYKKLVSILNILKGWDLYVF